MQGAEAGRCYRMPSKEAAETRPWSTAQKGRSLQAASGATQSGNLHQLSSHSWHLLLLVPTRPIPRLFRKRNPCLQISDGQGLSFEITLEHKCNADVLLKLKDAHNDILENNFGTHGLKEE